jgi:hypothetical protein
LLIGSSTTLEKWPAGQRGISCHSEAKEPALSGAERVESLLIFPIEIVKLLGSLFFCHSERSEEFRDSNSFPGFLVGLLLMTKMSIPNI